MGIGAGVMVAGLMAASAAASKLNKPKEPKSAKELEKIAARKAEEKRLSRAGAKEAKGRTKFASAPSMGMNLKNKLGA